MSYPLSQEPTTEYRKRTFNHYLHHNTKKTTPLKSQVNYQSEIRQQRLLQSIAPRQLII